MSTHSTIIQKTDDGFRAIYCHSDGYLEYNGAILQKYYQDNDKVTQLLDLGDLSILGKEIGTKIDFSEYKPEQCKAYTRDRGELNCETTEVETLVEVTRVLQGQYTYLWDGEQWLYTGTLTPQKLSRPDWEWKKLSDYEFKLNMVD